MRNGRYLFEALAIIGVLGILGLGAPRAAVAGARLVKEGQPCADIVVADPAPRMAALAAAELQDGILKISGATLPITNAPGSEAAVHVYVGRSPYTDALKITDAGLKYGAFRMVSGKDYLVLLGHDSDFAPNGPFHTGGPLKEDSAAMVQWDKLTGETWDFPLGNLFKQQSPPFRICEEARRGSLTSTVVRLWEKDQRGSLNAVYAFLNSLGMRWYLPGPLGEIVPQRQTIDVPAVDKTVRPDFPLRYPLQYYRLFSFEGATRDEILWQLRLGLDQASELMGDHELSMGHGITYVHSRDAVKKAHPEYFALYGGVRDTKQYGGGRPCLSSKGLFEANVKYVRAVFDIFGEPMVSVMPQDGYSLCDCPLCKDKGTPERGWQGQMSDYVWDYVNRVAKEVYKTHPDRKVSCLAYGTYLLPPLKIDTLSPNIVVGIAQGRVNYKEPDEHYAAVRQAWLEKMPAGSKHLWLWEYYLYGTPRSPSLHLPVYFPHAIARDLRSLRGFGLGEFIEVYREREPGIGDLAITHLNLYTTARLWWDADQNVDAMLDEYCTLFYGPARREMAAFLDYSEANYKDMGKSAEKIAKAFELLARARKKAPADSAYARRIALIADYIEPMKDRVAELAKGREGVPIAAIDTWKGAPVKIDGRLEDEAWRRSWGAELGEVKTGAKPAFPTSFSAFWAGDSLYIGIRCQDAGPSNLNFQVGKKDSEGIWNGDCLEFMLETQTHSYYQITVNPAGTMVDMDDRDGFNTLWSSGAEVAAHIDRNGWTVELRLPLAAANQDQLDPLNGIAGLKPTAAYPWYFNVCRQRVRPSGTELSAYAPAGKESFHELMKFGKLSVK